MNDLNELINNYEKLFNVAKEELGYNDFTYQEFINSSEDNKTKEIDALIESKTLDYFEGRDISLEFEEAFNSYYQEDNSFNNEFRDNFKKIFEFAIRKLKLGGLTFLDIMNLNENAPERVALKEYLDRVFKAYHEKRLDRNSMLYKAIDNFYKSDILNIDKDGFRIKPPVTADDFFRYGSKFKVNTSKVRNENNNHVVNNNTNNNVNTNTPNNSNSNRKPKKEPNKVVKFLKDGSKTVGYTLLVSANALFGGLGVISAIVVGLGGNIFIPPFLPVLAIGIPAATITGIAIKNRKKIRNKITSTINKIKNKFKITREETNENTNTITREHQVNNVQPEIDFGDVFDEIEDEVEVGDRNFADDEDIRDTQESLEQEPIETTFTDEETPQTAVEQTLDEEAPETPLEEVEERTPVVAEPIVTPEVPPTPVTKVVSETFEPEVVTTTPHDRRSQTIDEANRIILELNSKIEKEEKRISNINRNWNKVKRTSNQYVANTMHTTKPKLYSELKGRKSSSLNKIKKYQSMINELNESVKKINGPEPIRSKVSVKQIQDVNGNNKSLYIVEGGNYKSNIKESVDYTDKLENNHKK